MHAVLDTIPRCTLRGSLDLTTGIFYRAPERTRVRTPLACDKCRVRKAKVRWTSLGADLSHSFFFFSQCSGDRPVCERCRQRGLTCQYATHARRRTKARPVRRSDDSPPVVVSPEQPPPSTMTPSVPIPIGHHPEGHQAEQAFDPVFYPDLDAMLMPGYIHDPAWLLPGHASHHIEHDRTPSTSTSTSTSASPVLARPQAVLSTTPSPPWTPASDVDLTYSLCSSEVPPMTWCDRSLALLDMDGAF